MGVEVKVCGLTRAGDAEAAVRLGARYLGVVFAPGRRQVGVAAARDIVAAAGGVPVLGVFTDIDPGRVGDTAGEAGLAGVQLHGPHDAAAAVALVRRGLRVWRVARLAGPEDLAGLPALGREGEAVLVEPHVEDAAGGAGVALSFYLGREARRRLAGARLVLAGGLSPDNVARAIVNVGPDIVDVSSGVEAGPGRKDPSRILRFMEAVFASDRQG